MTPIGSRLKLKLDDEVIRMTNEWFFKWHHIGRERPVAIDSFRSKPIVYGGVRFSGSAQDVYWDTIQYYLRKQISSLFDGLEQEVKPYPAEIRQQAVEEARSLIKGFAARIRRIAIEKDRILRGDGMKFPPDHDFGTWNGSGAVDIDNRARPLLLIYGQGLEVRQSRWESANAQWDTHRWWIGIVGFVISVIGLFAFL